MKMDMEMEIKMEMENGNWKDRDPRFKDRDVSYTMNRTDIIIYINTYEQNPPTLYIYADGTSSGEWHPKALSSGSA